MLSLAMFVILLGVLIFVHELGHFLTAKRAGVRVERFSLGFGPVLLSRTVDGTCYSLCAVPLGGFVKMAGDVAEEFKGNKDEYYAQPVFFFFFFFVLSLSSGSGILLSAVRSDRCWTVTAPRRPV